MRRSITLLPLLLAALPSTGLAQGESEAQEPPPISKLPELIRRVDATYPAAALRERIEAVVVLELDISAEGKVERIGVVRSATVAETVSATVSATMPVASSTIADYGFVKAATVAASSFEFSPAEAGGKPVPVRIAYTYNFKLPPPPPPPIAAADTSTEAPPPPGVVNFRGIIRQRGTRSRVPGTIVTVFQSEGEPGGFEAVTNEEGEFELLDLAVGKWKVVAEADGYFPFRTTEEIKENEVLEVTYYVEKGSYNPYDVLVEAERVKKEVNRRTLKTAEIVKVPGTLGDPILVVENLPGVARTGGGQIVVRGSGPEDTRVFIDGVDVPLIYHFGGLRSVVPAEIIESIDFYPGNFSVYYGRGMGGVIDAQVKRLAPDQIHGALDVSLLDASLFFEIPIGDTAAIAIAGRRSYIDVVLNAVIPDDSSVSLVAAPRYYDYQILGSWRPTKEHDVQIFFFGSNDELELLFEDPADIDAQVESGGLETSTFFNRIALEYRFTPSKKFKNDLRFAVGRDVFRLSLFNQFSFNIENLQFQAREIASYKITDDLTVSAGFDTRFSVVDGLIKAPPPPREGDVGFNPDLNEVLVAEIDGEIGYDIAPFVEAELRLFEDLLLVPGLRLDYTETTDDFSVDPRIVARYRIDDAWTAKAGAGVVHQAPQPYESDESFGNPELGMQRATQYSVGAEWKPIEHILIDATVFYKDMDNLVGRSNEFVERDGQQVPEIFNNGAKGRVYGLELYVRHNFANNLTGWLTYTLSRAERTDAGDTESRLFSFDQTHIFALVASYVFRENWEAGVRWRVVTGNPYTPFVNGVFLSDFDRYSPVPGEVNSDRLPMFHQLDLRIEKRWVWDTWMMSAYFSLTNAYNQGNVESFSYNFDYSESESITGLPILPIIGIRGEI